MGSKRVVTVGAKGAGVAVPFWKHGTVAEW